MPLTTLLGKKEFKNYFKELPNLKQYFYTVDEDKEPFEQIKELYVPAPEGFDRSHASTIGFAYDWWFRAFLKRINNHLEIELDTGIIEMTAKLLKSRCSSKFEKVLKKRIKVYKLYADGKRDVSVDLIETIIQFGYIESYYRSGYPREKGYEQIDSIEIQDCKNLISFTETKKSYFLAKERCILNPTFGINSALVGGADGDFIIDDMLVDIKTTIGGLYGCLAQNNNQLIGYYLLATFNMPEPLYKLNNLGLWFPRQDQFVYFDMRDIKQDFNFDKFAKGFFKMIGTDVLNEHASDQLPYIFGKEHEFAQYYLTSYFDMINQNSDYDAWYRDILENVLEKYSEVELEQMNQMGLRRFSRYFSIAE